MICKNCNKHINDDSKFCQFCGEKAEKSDNTKLEEIDKKFLDHLEFLGYELNTLESQNNLLRYSAVHKSKPNLIFNSVKDTGISFVTFYTLDDKKVIKNRDEVLEIVNKMNNQALFCSFSLSTDNALVCAALYFGRYGKKEFADFLELYETDIQRALKADEKLLDFT